MNETVFLSIMATGFVVAFAHAAIPTHWLPFVLAGRGQRWSKGKTLAVVGICGLGHVLFTTLLGIGVVWLGIETSKWTGNVFPWIAGGALIIFGLYYIIRQLRGGGHGHHHFFGGHDHGEGGHDHGDHDHGPGGHDHGKGGHDHSKSGPSHDHEKGAHASHDHGKGGHRHDHEKGADAGHEHSDHGHNHAGHDHGPGGHGHGSDIKRIDTGHGALFLEVFEDGVPPRFRIRAEGQSALPRAGDISLETVRPGGARQQFSFAAHQGFLESLEEIPEPHEFAARVVISHGSHGHDYDVRFEEHQHAASVAAVAVKQTAVAKSGPTRKGAVKSDWAVFVSLFTLLTFSPCEGFIPVYISGITYGWGGFFLLSTVLATATVSGMMIFTWLTMSGMERLRLEFLEKYESGILGSIVLFLGFGIIFLGF